MIIIYSGLFFWGHHVVCCPVVDTISGKELHSPN